ncbi:MAG: 4-(cytidine 5'-diphospho)-2-C-methyl-D-erythritol kinase [Gemmatimonadetes bacterium]|nr:4-(cytidine 5'-diphospho)-2-C-methyl-D-erythritol kinase [Gemmatimonadota bacterium]
MTPRGVRMDAPAKVNLTLHVGARRADGYHELETLFQGVDLSDVVEVRREGAGIELTSTGEDAGPSEQNLALRAARAYLDAAGMSGDGAPGIRIRLEKQIPVAAGLGGGSSDAAATLKALDRLFEGAVGAGALMAIAARLGSDVPFFLMPLPLGLGRGRGEVLEPVDPLPALPGVVVLPGVRMSTAEAYGALDRLRAARPSATPPRLRAPRDWGEVASGAHNDFEGVVASAHPEVRDALSDLRATRPLVGMLSGSGASCFALYGNDNEADGASAALGSEGGRRTVRMRTLTAWPEPADL